MAFSLHAAAQHTGNSTSTILRAIISGRLAATKHEDGSYRIEPADLDGAFPTERRYRLDAFGVAFPPSDPKAPGSLAAIMEAELAGLLDMLHRADAAFANYAARRFAAGAMEQRAAPQRP